MCFIFAILAQFSFLMRMVIAAVDWCASILLDNVHCLTEQATDSVHLRASIIPCHPAASCPWNGSKEFH